MIEAVERDFVVAERMGVVIAKPIQDLDSMLKLFSVNNKMQYLS